MVPDSYMEVSLPPIDKDGADVGRHVLNQKIDNREMMRLREMLDDAGVDYFTCDSELPFPVGAGRMHYHTMSYDFRVDDDGCVSGFSVVLAPHSYGGNAGLLELWCKEMEESTGWLTADNVVWHLRRVGIVKGN